MLRIQKKLILLVLCVILVLISGCSRAPQISRSVSAENFIQYMAKFREISNKHILAMLPIETPISSSDDASHISNNFSLSRKDTEINVLLSNDALDFEQEGEETFLIAYMLPIDEEYDLDLFAELVNAVSGRTITAEYCEEFLRSIDVYDKNTRNRKADFSKSKPLNWEGNWVISYTLRETAFPNTYSQELSFTGLTSAKETAKATLENRQPSSVEKL